MMIRIRPPSAGESILCIDGGGVRGIIPLMMLIGVQESLDLPIPVQELFTMAYGTSVGWSLKRCATEFETLAKDAFQPESVGLLRWILSFFTDSVYEPQGIEKALMKLHGNNKMTDISYATHIGAKVGVLAATTENPSVYLFTNYNGVGNPRSGYHVIRTSENAELWEIYFPPKHIQGIGSFQDAGILKNNPVALALSEHYALHGDRKPDIVLNLGTGSTPSPVPPGQKLGRARNRWWPYRVVRDLLSTMEGRKEWANIFGVIHSSNRRDRFKRLDITMDKLPALDDVSSIPMLRSLVYQEPGLQEEFDSMASRLFTTLFYFELEQLPIKSGSKFQVSGNILCLRTTFDPALPKIFNRLKNTKIIVNGKPVQLNLSKDWHGNIHGAISFLSGDAIQIDMKEDGAKRAFPLSGTPCSLQKLVAASGLADYFGNRPHKRGAVRYIGELGKSDSNDNGRNLRKRGAECDINDRPSKRVKY
ncbi:unnamed protein product [Clonostachys rosea f. rosea IK726]|uniref:Uncharacterized protein n=1 Tax=Clonostachys rosea f. rosea IK726 TaxID=1349383 RepID=A0ACA9TEI7_BIOOC|nr:unnamed protein product [Clonostachys rosea f. rosea IK726]